MPPIPEGLYKAAEGNHCRFCQSPDGICHGRTKGFKEHAFYFRKNAGQGYGLCPSGSALGYVAGRTQVFFHENAARAGFKPGETLGEEVFQQIINHPEGIWVGKVDPENNLLELKTDDGKIGLNIPELIDELKSVDAANEEAALVMDSEFPLVLMAGRHISTNANTLMRNPAWNEGKRACTLAMHPNDAVSLKLTDGQQVRVITAAGSEEIELEVTDTAHIGHVVIPHGFGLVYNGKSSGANVNRLTKNTHRDE